MRRQRLHAAGWTTTSEKLSSRRLLPQRFSRVFTNAWTKGGGLWNKENVRSSASEQKETKQDALREPRPVSCLQTMCCWGDTAAPLSLFSGAAAHYHVQASGNESRQKRFHNRSVDGEPTMHGFRSATRASHVIAYCGRKCTSALLWSHKCRQAARRRIACPFSLKLTPKEGAYGALRKGA